jgi:hypothetical protein
MLCFLTCLTTKGNPRRDGHGVTFESWLTGGYLLKCAHSRFLPKKKYSANSGDARQGQSDPSTRLLTPWLKTMLIRGGLLLLRHPQRILNSFNAEVCHQDMSSGDGTPVLGAAAWML